MFWQKMIDGVEVDTYRKGRFVEVVSRSPLRPHKKSGWPPKKGDPDGDAPRR